MIKKAVVVLSICLNIYAGIPLFEAYPNLEKKLAHISLGNFPSPIKICNNIAQSLDCKKLYIKCDNLCGSMPNEKLFGGNKVRKLEFLLADALDRGSKSVITFGCVGSNHALATACYCNKLGLKCLLMLKPQPNSNIVQRNILLDAYYNAKICYFPNNELREIGSKYKIFKRFEKDGYIPYVIPTGGSNTIGIMGFINAAFELKKQIEEGLLPEPDFIYLPIGSFGTTVGLMIGLSAAGLKSKIIAVAVESGDFDKKLIDLFNETVKFIKKLDNNFPQVSTQNLQYINTNFCEGGYGTETSRSTEAINILNIFENIQLDQTYSAKAFAALIDDARNGKLKNKNILFWNTFCSEDFSEFINKVDVNKLPAGLHRYF